MPKFTTASMYRLVRQLFDGHPHLTNLHILYEITENLVPSETLLGDTEEGFEPHHFIGLVLGREAMQFASFGYAFGAPQRESVDTFAFIEGLPGIELHDAEKAELVSGGAARILGAVAFQKDGDDLRARLYRNPGIDRAEAIGFLKAAVSLMRESSQDDDAS